MADNKNIRDGDNTSFVGAADELGDGSFSPKVTLLAGDSSATPLPIGAMIGATNEAAASTDTATSGLSGRLQRIAQRITSMIALLPASLGVKAAAASFAVTLSTEDTAKLSAPTTGTLSAVNDTNSDTTILASNAARKGATIWNDSTEILCLALANVTSSATNCSARVLPGGYYELPVCQGGVYTGVIKGIWAANGSGAARVTELT